MFSATVVHIHDSPLLQKHEIHLSECLAATWHLQKGDSFTIFFGLTTIIVNITSIDRQENDILCSSQLLVQLRLQNGQRLRCSYLPANKTLLLGPVIAILTEIHETTLFGSIQDFCEELALLCEKKGCFLYVTSLSHFNHEDLIGYRYENEKWIKDKMPFPSIVYNRIHSRKTEQGAGFQSFLQRLKHAGIPHFNDRFLNKWEMHETLSTFPYLCPYIPHTVLFTHRNVLKEALHQFSSVFLKPVYGSQGRHIFKVTREKEGFSVDYTTFQGEIHRHYQWEKDLFTALKPYIANRPYIVQRGLDLYTYEGRSVDFRLLCHQTNHQWKVTSSIARVSAKNEFVSNVAVGGKMHKIEDVLYTHFDEKSIRHIKKLLMELAIETAKCVSQSYEGLYAELGMDLALDKYGNPWILEVNVKPSKNMPTSSSIRPSVRSILQYCCITAQQPIRGS